MNTAKHICFFCFVFIILCKLPQSESAPENSVLLAEAFQTQCLSRLLKATDSSSQNICTNIDSFKILNDSLRISVIQFGYCSSKFSFSIRESQNTILINATDTNKSISRCSCPFRLNYLLKGAGVADKKIIHVGIVHPELNVPCSLLVK
jgi:hypothetical protein